MFTAISRCINSAATTLLLLGACGTLHAEDLTPSADTTYDYIVVGAGAAGSVAASRLAQQGFSVLLLEAGPDTSPTSGVPETPNIVTALLNPFYAIAHTFDPNIADPFECSQLLASQVQLDFVSQSPGSDRYFAYPRGAGAGGTSQIATGTIDGVGSLKLYDKIAERVNDPYWRGDNILRIAKKMESAHPPRNPASYGHGGWLNISQSTQEIQDPIYSSILASANALGIPTQTDFRVRGNESGIGLVDSHVFSPFASAGQGDGLRSYSYKDLVLPTLADPTADLEVRFNSLVSRVLLEPRKSSNRGPGKRNEARFEAVGVEVLEGAYLQDVQVGGGIVTDGVNGRCQLNRQAYPGPLVKRYYARKEVIVSAGAIQTPQLLQLSGIGDGEHLRSVGVTPKVHLPGVGRNFMDHTEIFVQFEMDPSKWYSSGLATVLDALGADAAISDPAIKARVQSQVKPGLFAENQVALVLNWPSGVAGADDPERPDIHAITWTHVAPISFDGRDLGPNPIVDQPEDPHDHSARFFAPDPQDPTATPGIPNAYPTILAPLNPPAPRAYFSWLVENLQPVRTDGSVMIKSADPRQEPAFDAGLDRDDTGLERLAAGIVLVRQIMEHPDIKALALDPSNFELYPGKNAASIEDLKEYIRVWSAYGHHPSGTAGMGLSRERMAVVDSKLRVHKVNRLRVADTSVYPAPLTPPYNTARAAYIMGEAVVERILEDEAD